MTNLLGYMLTWTTYGTWLQGDSRGYVKDGNILTANPALEMVNRKNQVQESVYLSQPQQIMAREAVYEEAENLKKRLYAFTVKKSHIHLVVSRHGKDSSVIVARYKNAIRQYLRKTGVVGKIWTRGYDIKYCYTEYDLECMINYVNEHNC